MLARVRDWLGLERDIIVMILAILILTLGEQLWVKYVPKYLEYLGASIMIIGLYGSIKRIIKTLYQYPGGWLSDKLGPQRALIAFTLVAISGYFIYLFANNWEVFILGTLLVLVWDSMSQPAVFSLIGETLKRSRRAIGFSVQSILKRLPIIIAPPLGGYIIGQYSLGVGMKAGFLTSVVLAALALVIQKKFYVEVEKKKRKVEGRIVEVWKRMDRGLKKLLISDVLARLANNTIGIYVVLYVLNVIGAPPVEYGLLISIQMIAAIASYLPAAKLADIYGRRPFIALTFTFFALFPVALMLIPCASMLPIAFVIAGLREIGEPARKALIVDLAEKSYKARAIGLYYLIRDAAMIPAPILGGILWELSKRIMFSVSAAIGAIAVIIFIASRIESGK